MAFPVNYEQCSNKFYTSFRLHRLKSVGEKDLNSIINFTEIALDSEEILLSFYAKRKFILVFPTAHHCFESELRD
jgi:hypothetical protein